MRLPLRHADEDAPADSGRKEPGPCGGYEPSLLDATASPVMASSAFFADVRLAFIDDVWRASVSSDLR